MRIAAVRPLESVNYEHRDRNIKAVRFVIETRIPRQSYFCVGFTGAGVAGCVFTGCDLIPCSTDFGPLCPVA
jgi:hypothetical protein